ncbi:MAG TPA: DUF6567 family protein [Candidatus Acidoferrales bacterium]|nr:DUF6567 family protein [Candidatus Acidoferrales bacterium]
MKIDVLVKRLVPVSMCLTFVILVSGCSSVGEMRGGTTGTDVQLNQKNYKLIKAGAMGHSYGFKLLGILPFDSPTAADAKADLYKSVGEDLTGKAAALANQTEDRSSLYLILFSIPRITYTADVIEFTDPNAPPPMQQATGSQ